MKATTMELMLNEQGLLEIESPFHGGRCFRGGNVGVKFTVTRSGNAAQTLVFIIKKTSDGRYTNIDYITWPTSKKALVSAIENARRSPILSQNILTWPN